MRREERRAGGIFSETLSRSVNVHLAELALLRLGARPFHVVAPTPPQTAGVPIRCAIGRPVRYESVWSNEAKRRFLEAGMPGWKADALVHMYAYLQDPATTPLTVGFTALTGRPPRRLGDFVIEHARGFAKGTLRH